jgi:glycolate oxidase iron-sulfur subunit
MQTNLSREFKDTALGNEAEAILRSCVHCGFCTATCPTYQLLGDELDSPRGRIYLIKQVLEGEAPTEKTRTHLDRCLTCRNCESTCPSGVQYGKLIDIGRHVVEEKTAHTYPRPLAERIKRIALKEGLNSPLFEPAMKLGKAVRPLVPASLKPKVPKSRPLGEVPTAQHAKKVMLLEGCVQPAMMPTIHAALRRVLDRIGYAAVSAPRAKCCGAIRFHMNDQDGGRNDMRALIDVWWPLIERGEVEAIVMTASGCGVTVKEYPYFLQHDSLYSSKAQKIAEMTLDVSEFLSRHSEVLKSHVRASGSVAFHPPCTLQHGQRIKGVTEGLLRELGFTLKPFAESHLCCGSAGAYSVLQPDIAYSLRDRKLSHMTAVVPDVIASANIGCITHLQSGTDVPVRHWIETLDEHLTRRVS